MAGSLWRKIKKWVAGGIAVLLLTPGTVRADDKQVIDELRSRIEALEKQNEQLMKLINSGLLPSKTARPDPEPNAPATEADKKEQEKGQVQKIVEEYLKEQEERKKKEAEEAGHEIGKDLNMKARWDYGLWVETADKAFRIHAGGRTQFDTVWMTAPENVQFGTGGTGPIDDGVEFRRARLEIDGTIYEVIDFWCEYDFANTFNFRQPPGPATPLTVANTPVPTDLWFTVTHIPVLGNCRVGNQKPPISFEHLTSSRFLNFMERSFAFDAFIGGLDNGFRPGIQVFNWALDERMSWAVGVFKNQTNVFAWNVGDGETEVVGRVTGLPIYENGGRQLVHLGLGASHRDADDDLLRYRARTLLRNGPAVLHTTILDARMNASGETLIVPEFVVVCGPFLLQSEYYAVFAHDVTFPIAPASARVPRGDAFFQSAYVEVLYFLTGENRRYNRIARENRRIAVFDRVIPYENFYVVKDEDNRIRLGRGAWQVGARYSWIDLEDKGIFGGRAQDVTLGLNWFLNGNMKIQWNYIVEFRDLPVGTSNGVVQGFGVRCAWDF